MKKNILRYSIASAVGLALAFVILCFKNIFSQTDAVKVFQILCDAFFVTGICFACIGVIMLAGNGGAFDMLGYAFVMLFDALRKDISKRKYKDFYEYRQAKKEKKRNVLYMFVVGGAFIAISVIFLILYYQVG
ncbi:MAG: DUF3899 domain-containing protein [Firmicutes bacterium]|jgi:hypothetical protein|nr:DUF3899 domain-containing protein [Clostridia bacterium]MBS5023367.1 DUF3899 domain-containing protein [Bacillota bacterium]